MVWKADDFFFLLVPPSGAGDYKSKQNSELHSGHIRLRLEMAYTDCTVCVCGGGGGWRWGWGRGSVFHYSDFINCLFESLIC